MTVSANSTVLIYLRFLVHLESGYYNNYIYTSRTRTLKYAACAFTSCNLLPMLHRWHRHESPLPSREPPQLIRYVDNARHTRRSRLYVIRYKHFCENPVYIKQQIGSQNEDLCSLVVQLNQFLLELKDWVCLVLLVVEKLNTMHTCSSKSSERLERCLQAINIFA